MEGVALELDLEGCMRLSLHVISICEHFAGFEVFSLRESHLLVRHPFLSRVIGEEEGLLGEGTAVIVGQRQCQGGEGSLSGWRVC